MSNIQNQETGPHSKELISQKLGKVFEFVKSELHKDAIKPTFRAGDTLKVYFETLSKDKKIMKIFQGVCMRVGRAGFLVRDTSSGCGIEIDFSYLAPSKVEIVKYGLVRRANLNYLRSLKGKKARIKEDFKRKEKAK